MTSFQVLRCKVEKWPSASETVDGNDGRSIVAYRREGPVGGAKAAHVVQVLLHLRNNAATV